MRFLPPDTRGELFHKLSDTVHRVVISGTQIGRLEEAGLFPKRVGLNCRGVAWREREVTAWMQAKVDERPYAKPFSVRPNDRFICSHDVRHRTKLSKRQIDRLEKRGLFPYRVQIGEPRVAWLEQEIDDWCNQRSPAFSHRFAP